MNVAIFWDIAPYSLYVNRRFGATYRLHLQGLKSAEQTNQGAASRFLATNAAVPVSSQG
jgi:hypothetical protein